MNNSAISLDTEIKGTTPKGAPFTITIVHDNDGTSTRCVGFRWDAHDGVGPIDTGFRVKCWGEIFYRLTRGIEIPRNWWSHNEA